MSDQAVIAILVVLLIIAVAVTTVLAVKVRRADVREEDYWRMLMEATEMAAGWRAAHHALLRIEIVLTDHGHRDLDLTRRIRGATHPYRVADVESTYNSKVHGRLTRYAELTADEQAD